MILICLDANFRLKNQLTSNFSTDPGLGIGWAYMLPLEEYDEYVLSQADEDDVGTPTFEHSEYLNIIIRSVHV